ncbi:uncharacterized protein METZ01_LOCUS284030, partial [marine metagenome]
IIIILAMDLKTIKATQQKSTLVLLKN